MKLEISQGENRTSVEIEPDAHSPDRFLVRLGDPAGKGQVMEVELLDRQGGRWTLRIGNRIEDVLIHRRGGRTTVESRGRLREYQVSDLREKYLGGGAGRLSDSSSGDLFSQMPGKVVRILKRPGETVEAGEGLAIIEAMKMQNELKSPRSGTVRICNVEEGQSVEGGLLLFEIE